MRLTKKYTKQGTRVEHNRGRIEEGENDFHRLIIKATEDYDYANWQMTDLKDFRDALDTFIKELES